MTHFYCLRKKKNKKLARFHPKTIRPRRGHTVYTITYTFGTRTLINLDKLGLINQFAEGFFFLFQSINKPRGVLFVIRYVFYFFLCIY